ncbi:Armadillo-type fold [Pseudocohnilembus persalinus]|uniref:Armadillo-type fold n=1 Tax=Pseudocohnilembus persalinus TaxID=266149 RepID=A0A0V0QDQ4_PSEPJ|nr:Armadillo-type fold [Pseudocohnilembus persalinus]|eukprot:KRX00351.1 Armadillo-type fold [Pseudocohnilembus persalinus]
MIRDKLKIAKERQKSQKQVQQQETVYQTIQLQKNQSDKNKVGANLAFLQNPLQIKKPSISQYKELESLDKNKNKGKIQGIQSEKTQNNKLQQLQSQQNKQEGQLENQKELNQVNKLQKKQELNSDNVNEKDETQLQEKDDFLDDEHSFNLQNEEEHEYQQFKQYNESYTQILQELQKYQDQNSKENQNEKNIRELVNRIVLLCNDYENLTINNQESFYIDTLLQGLVHIMLASKNLRIKSRIIKQGLSISQKIGIQYFLVDRLEQAQILQNQQQKQQQKDKESEKNDENEENWQKIQKIQSNINMGPFQILSENNKQFLLEQGELFECLLFLIKEGIQLVQKSLQKTKEKQSNYEQIEELLVIFREDKVIFGYLKVLEGYLRLKRKSVIDLEDLGVLKREIELFSEIFEFFSLLGGNKQLRKLLVFQKGLEVFKEFLVVYDFEQLKKEGIQSEKQKELEVLEQDYLDLQIQISGLFRNLIIDISENVEMFKKSGCLLKISECIEKYYDNVEIVKNSIRSLTKVSLEETLARQIYQNSNFVDKIIGFLTTYQPNLYIILRVVFILENLINVLDDFPMILYFQFKIFGDLIECGQYYVYNLEFEGTEKDNKDGENQITQSQLMMQLTDDDLDNMINIVSQNEKEQKQNQYNQQILQILKIIQEKYPEQYNETEMLQGQDQSFQPDKKEQENQKNFLIINNQIQNESNNTTQSTFYSSQDNNKDQYICKIEDCGRKFQNKEDFQKHQVRRHQLK